MGKGLPRSHSRGGATLQEMIKQVFVVRDLPLTVDGASGVGFGTVVIGDLPEGNINLMGAVAYMQFTGPVTGGLVDAWVGDYSIGSTPMDDATIDAGDEDMILESPIAAATVEVSPRTRAPSAAAIAGTLLDNTDGSLELNLNMLVDDNMISADGVVFTVNGEFTLLYSVMQDD